MNNQDAASVASLANTFLSAPFVPDGWDLALRKLASETRSGRTQLIAFGGPSTIPFNWVIDPDPGFVEEFPLIDGGSPKVNWRVASSGIPLQLAWEHHYAHARRKLKSEVYDEFVDRFDLPYGCQTVLLDSPEMFLGLATLRSTAEGPTTEADREVFARAAPHVLTAIKIQQTLEHNGASLIAGAFEAINGAVFVCDRSGRVQALTPAAEAKLGEPLGLRLVHNRLVANRPDDDRAIQDALQHVLNDSRSTPGGVQFWLGEGPKDPHSHRCEVLPLPRKDWCMGFEPRALVSLHSPSKIDGRRREQLKTLLGLTRAEADIAILVADGLSREEIAGARDATVNTVSSQLKSIFLKAGLNREAQLVALVNRLLR